MRKRCLAIFFVIIMLFSACAADKKQDPGATSLPITDINDPNLKPLDLSDTEENEVLLCGGSNDAAKAYYEKTYEDYLAVYKFYLQKGFETYNTSEKNGNFFTTLIKESERIHIYWIACEEELTIIRSYRQGKTMPPKEPEITTGNTPTTVTQIRGSGENAMGYVIQLADGSFIIYDGGDATCSSKLLEVLGNLAGHDATNNKYLVRAWVLTINDEKHYGCFTQIAAEHTDKITLQTVVAAPVGKNMAIASKQTYLTQTLPEDVAKFEGAQICYVHTGMTLRFCNITMEILFTQEDLYMCDPPKDRFGNTSLVSRISTEQKSVLFLSDCGRFAARRMAIYYGKDLKSDICQIANHGAEDFPLFIYNMIEAKILFYPCSTDFYNNYQGFADVRQALANNSNTEQIILSDSENVTVVLD